MCERYIVANGHILYNYNNAFVAICVKNIHSSLRISLTYVAKTRTYHRPICFNKLIVLYTRIYRNTTTTIVSHIWRDRAVYKHIQLTHAFIMIVTIICTIIIIIISKENNNLFCWSLIELLSRLYRYLHWNIHAGNMRVKWIELKCPYINYYTCAIQIRVVKYRRQCRTSPMRSCN